MVVPLLGKLFVSGREQETQNDKVEMEWTNTEEARMVQKA